MQFQWTRRRILGLVILAAVAASIWPGYRWWRHRRMQQLAVECRQARDGAAWDRLDELASEWSRWDDSDGSAWMFLAEASEGNGDAERTAEYLAKVPDDDPRCLSALAARVELLFQDLNRPLDAVATCERILRIDPQTYVARRRLIYFYALSLQRRELVDLIRESIQLGYEPPESYVYLFTASQLKFSNGYHTNSRWLEHHPDYEPFVVAHAAFYEDSGQATEFSLLENTAADEDPGMAGCARRFPDNVEVLMFQLEKVAETEDLKRFDDLMATASADAKQDGRFWRHQAWLHSMRGENQASRSALEKSVELNPYDWQSRHQLAIVFRRLRMADEAGRMASLAETGKLLTREILELPNASEITPALLGKLATYAARCGDMPVSNAIRQRIE